MCIINNEGIEEDWTVEAKIKLATKVIDDDLQEKMNYGLKKMTHLK